MWTWTVFGSYETAIDVGKVHRQVHDELAREGEIEQPRGARGDMETP